MKRLFDQTNTLGAALILLVTCSAFALLHALAGAGTVYSVVAPLFAAA